MKLYLKLLFFLLIVNASFAQQLFKVVNGQLVPINPAYGLNLRSGIYYTTGLRLGFSTQTDSGTVRYNNGLVQYYNGGAWVTLSSSGGGAGSFTKQQIDTVGTVLAGVWQGTSIDTAYTNAVSNIISANNMLTVSTASKTKILTIDSTILASKSFVANTYVPLVRTITTGYGINGGGALTANLTLVADTTELITPTDTLYNVSIARQNDHTAFDSITVGESVTAEGIVRISDGTSEFGRLRVTALSSDRTYTFPNQSGTVMMTSDTASLSARIDTKLNTADSTKVVEGIYTNVTYSGHSATVDVDTAEVVSQSTTQVIDGIKVHTARQYYSNVLTDTIDDKSNNGGVILDDTLNVRQKLIAKTGINAYDSVRVHGFYTTINRHAFEDYSEISTSAGSSDGYASFDALPQWTGSGTHSHYVGAQLRPYLGGSISLQYYFYGLRVFPTHAGSGSVENYNGIRISSIAGGGAIVSNYGLYIENVTGGSAQNWAIYTEGGGHRFGGDTYINGKLLINTAISTYQLNLEGDSFLGGRTYIDSTIFQRYGDAIKSAQYLTSSMLALQTIAGYDIVFEPATVEALRLSATNGNATFAADVAVNGDDITSDGDLTITPAGGDATVAADLAVTGSGLSTFNGTNAGTATIGAGDSVQVSVTGLTTSGVAVVSYKRSGATAVDTAATWHITETGKLSLFGKFGWVVSYWIGKK